MHLRLNDIHRWLFTVLLLIICQLSDFITIPDNPGWYLYLWGAFVDSVLLLFIFHIRLKTKILNNIPCWLVLCTLQIAAVACHLSGFITELSYNMVGYEQLAVLNDQYTPCLITILVLKVLTLMVGGYGIKQRYITNRRTINRSHYDPGLIVIRNTITNQVHKT